MKKKKLKIVSTRFLSGGSFFMFHDHFVTIWLHYFWT